MPFSRNSDLPVTVRNVLPEAAQTVYRKAFNSRMEGDDANEAAAHATAWRAVKRQFSPPAPEAQKWTRRAGDGLEMADTLALDGIRRTGDGYLTAIARVARTGIQVYRGYEVGRPELDRVRVYRPAEEVFDEDAMRSFAHRPITVEHPSEAVTADNWKELSVGHTGDEIDGRDGKFIKVPLVLMDAAAIKAVEEGKRELSMGYQTKLDWQDGQTAEGEAYDAIQRSIRANHLAIVSTARGGPDLRIGDRRDSDDPDPAPAAKGAHHMSTDRKTSLSVDGLTVEMDPRDAEVVKRTIDKLTADNTDLSKRLADAEKKAEEDEEARRAKEEEDKKASDAKDGEIAALKQQLADDEMTPAKLDALVKDRAALVDKARTLIGDKLVTDGKSAADIRRQVVAARLGDEAIKDWSEDKIGGAFDTLTVASKDNGAAAGVGAILADRQTASDAAEKAIAERDKRLQDAWKGHRPGAA